MINKKIYDLDYIRELQASTRQIRACISIISRGEYDKEDYVEYLKGIRSLTDHILGKKFTPEIAAEKACSVMCLAASALTQTDYPKIADAAGYAKERLTGDQYKRLAYIRVSQYFSYMRNMIYYTKQ